MKETRPHFQNQSLGKGLKVLELLCERQEMTVSEVAREIGLNRASAHRYLVTLRELGYVEMTPQSHYQVTLKIMELGMKLADRFDIRRFARPHMLELSSQHKETVNLGYWDGCGPVLLDKVDSLEILRTNSPLGVRLPAYCTSQGKAMLAFMPEQEIEFYLRNTPLEPHGPRTITSVQAFREELVKIHSQGYSLEDEEYTVGLRCIGVPVFDARDYPSYALSVAGLEQRLPDERIPEIEQSLRRHAGELSRRLGHPGKARADGTSEDATSGV